MILIFSGSPKTDKGGASGVGTTVNRVRKGLRNDKSCTIDEVCSGLPMWLSFRLEACTTIAFRARPQAAVQTCVHGSAN